MTYSVIFSDAAKSDIQSVVDFISRDSEARALAFVEGLRQRMIGKLSLFPASGAAVGRFRYSVFDNYVVVYSVDDAASQVRIVLVTEGHRDWHRLLAGLE